MIRNSLIFSLNGWFNHQLVMFCCWRISHVHHKPFLSFERWGTSMVLLFWWKLSFHDQTAGGFLFFFPTKKQPIFIRGVPEDEEIDEVGGILDFGYMGILYGILTISPPNKRWFFPEKIGWGVDLVLMITTVDTKLGDMRILLASSNWKMMILASFPRHSYTCREYASSQSRWILFNF